MSIQNLPVLQTSKLIADPGVLTLLMTIDQQAAFATVQMGGTNDSANSTKIRVAISKASVASAVARVDYIEVAESLEAGARWLEYGRLVGPGDSIYVQSDNGQVIFNASALVQMQSRDS